MHKTGKTCKQLHFIPLLVLLLSLATTGYSQVWSDTLSSSYSRHLQQQYQSVAKELSKGPAQVSYIQRRLSAKAQTEFEALYFFYYWIADHISYDLDAFTNDLPAATQAQEIITGKTTQCEGYSLLFERFCKAAGISCYSIAGYTLQTNAMQRVPFDQTDHSWNVVRYQGRWYHVDVTWGAGKTNRTDLRADRPVDLQYLLAEPGPFLKSHLPEDPNWQLISYSISMETFYKNRDIIPSLLSRLDQSQVGKMPNDTELNRAWAWEVRKNERMLQYNPNRTYGAYWLAFSWLYLATDLRDSLYHFSLPQLKEQQALMQSQFEQRLTQADSAIELFRAGSPADEAGATFVQELHYQRGIYHYELASYLLWGLKELYDTNLSAYRAEEQAIKELASKHYDLATDWLRQVEVGSFYAAEAARTIASITEARKTGL